MDVVCGPGTYVRALAADLGQAARCGAYLSFLVRTRVGRFEIADALTLEECEAAAERGEFGELVLPMDWPLAHLPAVELDGPNALRFVQGTRVTTAEAARAGGLGTEVPRDQAAGAGVPALQRVYGVGGRFLGLGEMLKGQLRPQVVLAAPEGGGP